ncbi:MAG: S8 family serine peptidase [Dehalococcoidia bacterium]|nr:S8 family serine peptidase [Dehalococcoidia bacterium]
MHIKRTTVALAIAIVLICSLPTIVLAIPPDNHVSGFSSQQILVKFKPGTSLPEVAEIHRQLGGQVKETIPGIGVQVVTVPEGHAMAKAKAYSSNARVAYAEPDFVAQALGSPDDPYFDLQWGLTKIEAPQAWEVTTGSGSINIAILDTGVDLDHPDLANKIVSNIDFSTSATTNDVYNHGTHVAGIAAAMTNNAIGVAGLGYTSTIMNVKVLSDTGSGSYSGIASGIIWAADNGAEIINLSLAGSFGASTLEDAVNYAWSKGVVVVAAAGNSGNTTPMYPAYYTNCIAVAATDINDARASWSNYGDWVDVAAPGASIYSMRKDNKYGYGSGTSMASPHVAGLAALVFTMVSDANGDGQLNDEVRARIEATCDDIGIIGIGSGRINAYRAVQTGAATGAAVGIVTSSGDGMSVVGATVSDGVRTSLTDASGHYGITGIPEGTYTLTASAPGYYGASQAVSVVAQQTATADFALPKLPALWVESITFGVSGKNLCLTVEVVSESGAVAGAQVAVQLTNGVQNWNFAGSTDSSGTATFVVTRAPTGTYTATVTALTLAGYCRDTTRGVNSASYTLKKGGGRR